MRAVRIAEDGASFTWTCPTCGRGHYGYMADEPVGGWEAPRWVNSGTAEAPTLTPSLGCSGMRDGSCNGHWLCRKGELVAA